MRQFKVIVEKHTDGYVAYPLGLKGVVVGEGDTYEEALADVKSAIAFHIETFGPEVFEDEASTLIDLETLPKDPVTLLKEITDHYKHIIDEPDLDITEIYREREQPNDRETLFT
jgi:predicted RNase H-like HicB family nuclease